MAPRRAAGNTYEVVGESGAKRRLVLTPDGAHVAEHRLVFEQTWNVKLKKWHRVKHINGDTLDNRPENLVLDNEYAMELLRQGKSIADAGKLVCPKGHRRDHLQQMKDGTTRYVCPTCIRDHARHQRAVTKLRRDAAKRQRGTT